MLLRVRNMRTGRDSKTLHNIIISVLYSLLLLLYYIIAVTL